jgi:hypothetical protein
LSRQLVVTPTTKPNRGHLAPASEDARGHTILKLADHSLYVNNMNSTKQCYLYVVPCGYKERSKIAQNRQRLRDFHKICSV